MYDQKTKLITSSLEGKKNRLTDKVFKVEFYLKPRRANMSKKRMEEILKNVTVGMNRQYRDEIKQSSSVFVYEHPAENYIFRGKVN